jgi:perosamine synthetase
MTLRPDYLPFGRPDFTQEEIDAVARVMRSGWIGMGPETERFEHELAEAVGAPHVVTVNSCTSALFLALLVHDIGPGDEVICPSLTWCSTANAILYAGATPVFCDVDSESFCITTTNVLRVVTPRTKAVIVVHFGGLAVETKALRGALSPKIALIEDAAHALGSQFSDDSFVGSSGNATCFSFYANKNLSTGEGGAVALFDARQADRIRSLRQHALPVDAWKRFTHSGTVMLAQQLTELGYKANYTDMQAAIGRVQLRRLASMAKKRRSLADAYLESIASPLSPLRPQQGLISGRHALHLFTVRVSSMSPISRNDLLLELRRRNIGATIHYTVLHLMPLYHRGKASPPSLPATEAIGRDIITLPTSASMLPEDVQYVCSHVSSLIERKL